MKYEYLVYDTRERDADWIERGLNGLGSEGWKVMLTFELSESRNRYSGSALILMREKPTHRYDVPEHEEDR